MRLAPPKPPTAAKTLDAGKRVSVRDAAKRAKQEEASKLKGIQSRLADKMTTDSFQNFLMGLGVGTDNPLSASSYGFNPVTRERIILEWVHRGSWLAGVAIDLVADDMTRAGVDLIGELQPDDIEKIEERINTLGIWEAVNDTLKWARLYGGCIAVMLVDGQELHTPFRLQTVGRDQFRGLVVLDRWMVEPSLQDLVRDPGPHMGLPKYYRVVSDAPALMGQRIHYTRCLRLEGIRLPYYQRLMENLWGISIIERLYDRMVAFDAATQGAAQLIHKSYLRTYKAKDLRSALAAGGKAEQGVIKAIQMMRATQSNEGITIIDGEDEFTLDQSSGYSGISDMILRFGEQLSGALQIPLVRLFGQSPAGLSSTGESDLRTYYDGIKQQQVRHLKQPLATIYRCVAQSLGITLPKGFGIEFRSLWQLTEKERAETAGLFVTAVDAALGAGIIDKPTAAKELRQSAEITGVFTNITEQAIKQLEQEVELEEVPEPPEPGSEEAQEREAQVEAAGKGARAVKAAQRAEGMVPVKGGEQQSAGPQKDTEGAYAVQLNEKQSKYEVVERAGGRVMAAFPFSLEKGAKKTESKRLAAAKARAQVKLLGRKPEKPAVKDAAYPNIGGLDLVIETCKDEMRRGGRGQDSWQVRMPADYGYIRNSSSAEGPREQMDCFVGPNHDAPLVWVIHQKRLSDGKFDEHKCLLGFNSSVEALDCYGKAFSDGKARDRIMRVDEMKLGDFKEWLAAKWQYGGAA